MSVIANRYIQALLELDVKDGLSVAKSLNEISGVFNSNKEFKRTMLDPRVGQKVKVDILKEVFPEYAKETWLMNFIELLIKEKRIDCLGDIAKGYKEIILEQNRELKMKIIVANHIDENQVRAIVEKYKKMYNAQTVKYVIEKDESILGGVKVVIGNRIYDGSVATQLKHMI